MLFWFVLSKGFSRFWVCSNCCGVARVTRFLSTSWNLKLVRAYLCNSHGLFFGRILMMSLFSIFFRTVWILRMNWALFVSCSPYSFLVRSLTFGNFSSSWKDAICFARSCWYSPCRKRMFVVFVFELMLSCNSWVSFDVRSG